MAVEDKLIDRAVQIADDSDVPKRSNQKIADILGAFELLTPASRVGDLANILNAAWIAFHNQELWKGVVDNRVETLNELVLKSIEILEIESRSGVS